MWEGGSKESEGISEEEEEVGIRKKKKKKKRMKCDGDDVATARIMHNGRKLGTKRIELHLRLQSFIITRITDCFHLINLSLLCFEYLF